MASKNEKSGLSTVFGVVVLVGYSLGLAKVVYDRNKSVAFSPRKAPLQPAPEEPIDLVVQSDGSLARVLMDAIESEEKDDDIHKT